MSGWMRLLPGTATISFSPAHRGTRPSPQAAGGT